MDYVISLQTHSIHDTQSKKCGVHFMAKTATINNKERTSDNSNSSKLKTLQGIPARTQTKLHHYLSQSLPVAVTKIINESRS